MNPPTAAFLVPADLPTGTLAGIAARVVELPTVVPVTFPESGGDVDMDLSVPFLPGMDEVVVSLAGLSMSTAAEQTTIHGWHTAPGPAAAGGGLVLVLDAPARLCRLAVQAPAAPTSPETYVVIRAAQPGPPPTAGPPLFAQKQFAAVGAMFDPPLPTIGVAAGGGTVTLTLPDSPAAVGQAWLLQYASGASLAELTPSATQPTAVLDVTVISAPSDVELALRGDGADPDQQLWAHPGQLLPGTGVQRADFTPAAGARLSRELARASGADATLALPLRFHAGAGGTLHVLDRSLDVRYLGYPAGREKTGLDLDGDWVDLALAAPVRTVIASALDLRARHLGRELVPGTPAPPTRPPTSGVHVAAGRVLAAPFESAAATATPLQVVAVRLLIAPSGSERTELTCQLRADAGGAPGAPLGRPAVVRAPAEPGPAWVRLDLAEPVPIPPTATIWVTLRTTTGACDWFAADSGPCARVSADGGQTWTTVQDGLAGVGTPWVQLQHRVEPPASAVSLTLRNGDQLLDGVDLTPSGSPAGYAGPTTLPSQLSALLAATAGSAPGPDGRRSTRLSLFCPASLELTLAELRCSYDPFA